MSPNSQPASVENKGSETLVLNSISLSASGQDEKKRLGAEKIINVKRNYQNPLVLC